MMMPAAPPVPQSPVVLTLWTNIGAAQGDLDVQVEVDGKEADVSMTLWLLRSLAASLSTFSAEYYEAAQEDGAVF